MSKPLVKLIDMSGLLYRMFHTRPPEFYKGQRIETAKAVIGAVKRTAAKREPELAQLIFGVFDPEGKNFRHEIDPEYKSDKSGMPEELKAQEKLVQKLLPVTGANALIKSGLEADDTIAALASYYRGQNYQVIVETVDKDMLQLVSQDVSVYNPMTKVMYDSADKVRDKMGVGPELIPDLLAITGDKSDGIEGVQGVGPKTAAKWLEEHGSVASLLDNAEAIKGKAGVRLREASELVKKNVLLTRLKDDVDGSLEGILKAVDDGVVDITGQDREQLEADYGIDLSPIVQALGSQKARSAPEEEPTPVGQQSLF